MMWHALRGEIAFSFFSSLAPVVDATGDCSSYERQ